jgi:hypothetical protein
LELIAALLGRYVSAAQAADADNVGAFGDGVPDDALLYS